MSLYVLELILYSSPASHLEIYLPLLQSAGIKGVKVWATTTAQHFLLLLIKEVEWLIE